MPCLLVQISCYVNYAMQPRDGSQAEGARDMNHTIIPPTCSRAPGCLGRLLRRFESYLVTGGHGGTDWNHAIRG